MNRPCRNSVDTMPHLNGDHAATQWIPCRISMVTMPQLSGTHAATQWWASTELLVYVVSQRSLSSLARKFFTLLYTGTPASGGAPLRALPPAASSVETRATARATADRRDDR